VIGNPFSYRYTVSLPKNLDIDDIFQKNGFDGELKLNCAFKYRDRAAYLIGQIYNAMESKDNVDEYVCLYSPFLKDAVRHYKRYIDFFIEHEVLDCDNTYHSNINSSKSLGYRFTEKHRNNGWKQYHIYDENFLKTIYKTHRPKEVVQKYNYLYKWLSDLDYDEDQALKVLDELYPVDDDNKRHQWQMLQRIKNPKMWTFKTCTTGRLFTPVTNLKKELRDLLTYKDTPLIEVDIKNAIPYFSLSILDLDLLQTELVKKYMNKANPSINLFDRIFKFMSPLLMLGKNKGRAESIQDWKDRVLNGTIYDYLADRWNIRLDKDYSRKEAKTKLLAILNSPSIFKSPERSILQELYPDVIHVFDMVNSGYFKTKNAHGAAKWKNGDLRCPFAQFSQGLESYFVLDDVCKDISESDPEIPMFTVHDAILTTGEYLSIFHVYMSERSIELFNSPLGLKVDEPENIFSHMPIAFEALPF